MRKSRRPIVIASRRSLLARIQAQAVGAALAALHPEVAVEYRWIESEADRIPDAPLAEAGGKALFARAIEQALLRGEADLAVHSLKDLPAIPDAAAAGLVIAAVPQRGDVRDCLITADPAVALIEDLPRSATLGTASPRRASQLLRLRPDLKIALIRGNVETRLRKVRDERLFDATLLAVAGLTRAGLAHHATRPIDPAILLPAAGQGALALQCRSDDHVTISRCLPLNHSPTAAAVHAERTLVAALGGDCHSSIAVLAEPAGDLFRLRARVLGPDGRDCLETDQSASSRALGKLIKKLSRDLLDRGAKSLLRARPASATATPLHTTA